MHGFLQLGTFFRQARNHRTQAQTRVSFTMLALGRVRQPVLGCPGTCIVATSAVEAILEMARTMSFLRSSAGGGVTVFFLGHFSSGRLIQSNPFW